MNMTQQTPAEQKAAADKAAADKAAADKAAAEQKAEDKSYAAYDLDLLRFDGGVHATRKDANDAKTRLAKETGHRFEVRPV